MWQQPLLLIPMYSKMGILKGIPESGMYKNKSYRNALP
ncbi:hypothetical protein FLA_2720 [Filimonas lacunae]|nr:hypothetical protein FLA_2720 [Filimonas lacunae]